MAQVLLVPPAERNFEASEVEGLMGPGLGLMFAALKEVRRLGEELERGLEEDVPWSADDVKETLRFITMLEEAAARLLQSLTACRKITAHHPAVASPYPF